MPYQADGILSTASRHAKSSHHLAYEGFVRDNVAPSVMPSDMPPNYGRGQLYSLHRQIFEV